MNIELLQKLFGALLQDVVSAFDRFDKGAGEATLIRIGVWLRRKSWSEYEIRAALAVINEHLCNPVLVDEDVRRIASVSCSFYCRCCCDQPATEKGLCAECGLLRGAIALIVEDELATEKMIAEGGPVPELDPAPPEVTEAAATSGGFSPTHYRAEICPRCAQRSMPPFKSEMASARACQNPGCRCVQERSTEGVSE